MNNGFVKVASVTPSLKVADCVYNVKEIIALTHEIYEKGVSVIVFPELSLTGYTCGDLFLSRVDVRSRRRCLRRAFPFHQKLRMGHDYGRNVLLMLLVDT